MLNNKEKKAVEKEMTQLVGSPFSLQGCKKSTEDPYYVGTGSYSKHGNLRNVTVSIKDGKVRYWHIDGEVSFEMKAVGAITLGDKVRVTDPSYGPDVWCATTVENVMPGQWNCYIAKDVIDSWGERVWVLGIMHECVGGDKLSWEEVGEVGVDSGQMSIIDLEHYMYVDRSPAAHERFYSSLGCEDFELIENDERAHVGAKCSSGCGDGGYPLSIAKDKDGKVIGIQVNFSYSSSNSSSTL